MLFKDCPKIFLDRIEQVIRLIRSKGVGIYFISQSPNDIPDSILGQLGNRVQHALRAYTPKEAKALKVAAQSFRVNPNFDTKTVLTELSVGEALVSTLQDGGVPGIVQRTLIAPPQSQIGPLDAALRHSLIESDSLFSTYKEAIDPESAHEILLKRQSNMRAEEELEQRSVSRNQANTKAPKRRSSRQGVGEAFLKSVARSLGAL